jgi:hypothetical protein
MFSPFLYIQAVKKQNGSKIEWKTMGTTMSGMMGEMMSSTIGKMMGEMMSGTIGIKESEDENNESLLCSQLQAMLASPEPSPLLCKCKCGVVYVGNTNMQCELPPDARRSDKKP